jgi:hypothetical protein
MSRSNSGILTKVFLIGGFVMFVLLDFILIEAFRKNPGPSPVRPLDVYMTCFITVAPLFAGMRGFFLVKKLMSNSNGTDKTVLRKLSREFSFEIVAAYGALAAVVALLLNLHPSLR